MKSKLERRVLHTTNLKTVIGPSKRGNNRERVYHKNEKSYKEIKIDGQKYVVPLDKKEK